MSALKTSLEKLVAQAQARDIYGLSEMHIQSSYVVKVFEMLGWNDGGMSQGARQDVATGKVPDILLKDANGWTMMVVECKEAGNSNKLDGYYGSGKSKKTFAQQLVNYCKAEGVYWGVLTNFIEWRLYTVKFGQIYQNKKYAFHDLLWPGADKSGYIDLLSKEGLDFLNAFKRHPLCKAQGLISQDKIYYPEEKTIREDFFLMLKGWREALRSELWTKNNHLLPDKEKIDLYAQKILDRMIFIDVCHDKRIIGPNAHDSILYTKRQVYDELKKWFATMDERFNTDLFETDKYIEGFEISNEVLAPIVSELASVDFSRLPVNIIGDVYEDYLGEMLRGGKKQGIKVREDKARFKRKSQGIYYTPEYIVDYIVSNTVGELLDKTSTAEEIKKIKVLDPACGSGSFLINAFDKFYAAYKKAAPEKKDFDIKKTILQNNLYGVDLDERAVEICKLNLMLKALDKHKWDELKGRKLLPSLHLNIRHGNSLISGKSLAPKEQLIMFNVYEVDRDVLNLLKLHKQYYKASEDKEKHKLWIGIQEAEEGLNRRLNGNLTEYFSKPDDQQPLNFEVAFPEVFAQGGFDAVIGNPPWVQSKFMDNSFKNYYEHRYGTARKQYDIFNCFVEKSNEVMKENGKFGFIIPNRWLMNPDYISLRQYLIHKVWISEIVDVGENIFEDVKMPSLLLFYDKSTDEGANAKNTFKIKYDVDNKISTFKSNHLLQGNIAKDGQYLFSITQNSKLSSIFTKIETISLRYGDFVSNARGVEIGKKTTLFLQTKKKGMLNF